MRERESEKVRKRDYLGISFVILDCSNPEEVEYTQQESPCFYIHSKERDEEYELDGRAIVVSKQQHKQERCVGGLLIAVPKKRQ